MPRSSCRSRRQLGFTGASVFSDRDRPRVGREDVPQRRSSRAWRRCSASRCWRRDATASRTQCSSRWTVCCPDDWRSSARYMISRSLIHGRRRAEEMREVARTVGEAGFEPRMSSACAVRQDWAAAHRAAAAHEDLDDMLDCDDGRPQSGKRLMLIIDCHGHYTTAPDAHQQFRDKQLARLKDPSAAGAVAGAHQRRRDPRDDREEPAASCSASAAPTSRSSRRAPRRWRITSATRRRRRPGRAPATISSSASSTCIRRTSSACASCRSRRACRSRTRSRSSKRCVTELGFVGCNLNPDPSGGHWTVAAAHRQALVSVLREDGRARRAGDDPRVGVVQSELPCDRRALHQRRHDGVHAVHRRRSVPATSRRCASSSRTAAAPCRITGAAIAVSPTC